MGYIDLHCHLLPGVDDGPEDMSKALELAGALSSMGVKEAVITPHYIDGADYSENRQEKITGAFESFKKELKREDLSLAIHLGGELTFNHELISLADEERLPTLGNSSYLLLELPFFQPLPIYTGEVIFELQARGYGIIMAHPERVTAFYEKPGYLYELYEKGVLYQLNMGSFEGFYGKRAKKLACEMKEKGLFHLVATDAHNHLAGRLNLKDNYEDGFLDKYFCDHPQLVLENGDISTGEVEPLDEEKIRGSRSRHGKRAYLLGLIEELIDKIKSLFIK